MGRHRSLALIVEEDYLNPFSLMLGAAALAILWRVVRALSITLGIRRDGAASLVVRKESSLRQGGRLLGEVQLGPGAVARLDGEFPGSNSSARMSTPSGTRVNGIASQV
mgnify:CR=1 FL=1